MRANALQIAMITILAIVGCDVAQAQVIEIGENGAIRTRDGGGPVEWHDGTDIPVPPTANLQPSVRSFSEAESSTRSLLFDAAHRAGVHPAVLEALVWQESRWRPRARSNKGAMGLTQLMPQTARELGVDPWNPATNLQGGARYLRKMLDRFDGDLVRALAAYNAGPLRVEKANGVPNIPETRGYVSAIINRLRKTRKYFEK